MIATFTARKADLLQALLEHIELSFISLLIAVVIAVPLSIYLTRHKRLAEPIINMSAVLQTIPSLALLGLMIPLFGIGTVPAIIALVVYALLPIMRNTYTGIIGVDASLIEAARALGMNKRQRLFKVELPLAMPIIMAGIRTAMVLIIGTATLAALIGAGGLGDLILLGIDRNNPQLILLGAVPAALLAIIFDSVLRGIEKLSYRKSMLALIALMLLAVGIILAPMVTKTEEETITIGGKLGAEPAILIEMYKALIEQDTDLHVTLKPGLGKTSFLFNALKNGDIDIYPEFTGTAINELLKEQVTTREATGVYNQAKDGMAEKFNMRYLAPMQFNNTYALAVKQELGITKISELAALQNEVRAGFTLEFADRQDGYLGIQSLYGITFKDMVTMEPKLRYTALEHGDIDVLDAYATDSELETYQLKVLEDDKTLFPPYQGAPLLRQETLEQYPELEDILQQLAGKVTDEEMRKMNYAVNVDDANPRDVARDFLQQQGLLKP
ncbi:Glycine betaine/carnitine/choline transport system permease protein OpuCB [Metalysinibacillus saudimassiliensis]|uniref:Glycine betaine/carnitine/choline transport system permease protein OpuCB n=1 Tax=Metalysinibacillus saudimassiliensis TaxID=1461583 RepID=A0A078M0M2_9BACL|nr:Glycine betaine/carnitine/choline transport system permease protein OpuCB [Metalysinibacillus saudimassiliensis]